MLLFGIFGFLGVKGEVGREKEGERGNLDERIGGRIRKFEMLRLRNNEEMKWV